MWRPRNASGIVVANIPTYGTASVAQFVFALLLELCHNVKLHADAVRAGEWSAIADWSFLEVAAHGAGREDHGDRGLRPHRARSGPDRRCHGDARDLRTTPCQQNAPLYTGFRWAELEELLREADVVSLHSPLFPETRGMINSRHARADEAVGFPDQYVARAAGGGPGFGRCAERGTDCRRCGLTCFPRSRRSRQSAAFGAQLPGDAAHRVGYARGAGATDGSRCGESVGVSGGQTAKFVR